jgi:hypothetical protein
LSYFPAAHARHNITNNIVRSAGNGIDLGEIVIFLYVAAAIVVVVLTRNRLGVSRPLQGLSTASTSQHGTSQSADGGGDSGGANGGHDGDSGFSFGDSGGTTTSD